MTVLLLLSLLLATDDPASLLVELTEQEARRAGIETAEVALATTSSSIRVVGEVVRSPGATHPVRTLVDARVEKLSVSPGDRVVVGQELMVLHAHQLHILQARLLAAIQGLRLAENRLASGRQLLEIEGSRLDAHDVLRIYRTVGVRTDRVPREIADKVVQVAKQLQTLK